jgi:hypothetical protein
MILLLSWLENGIGRKEADALECGRLDAALLCAGSTAWQKLGRVASGLATKNKAASSRAHSKAPSAWRSNCFSTMRARRSRHE